MLYKMKKNKNVLISLIKRDKEKEEKLNQNGCDEKYQVKKFQLSSSKDTHCIMINYYNQIIMILTG